MTSSLNPAFHDALTGLFNGMAFHVIGDHVLKVAAREKKEIALFYADIKGLGAINQDKGWAEGERALEDVAGLLRASFRESDLLARLGEDEFAVLGVSPQSVLDLLVGRLRENLDFHNQNNDRAYKIQLTIGAVVRPPESLKNCQELLNLARQTAA